MPEEGSRKPAGREGLGRRLLLLSVATLAPLAVLAAAVFYFLNISGGSESGEGGGAETAEAPGEEPAREEENSDMKEVSLEDVLAAHYRNCWLQEGDLVGQPVAGYRKLRTCLRPGEEGDPSANLQVYTSEDPDGTVSFAAAHVFCTGTLGDEFLLVEGNGFLIVPIVPLDSQAVAEAQNPLDVFTPEYVRTFNAMSASEKSFLEGKGLEAELVNACEELARPAFRE